MKFAVLLPVAAASLRRRWSGFLGSFVALSLGVALLAVVGMMVDASAGSDTDPRAPSLHKLLMFSAGAAAFVSVFVVAGTFAFAVTQRRRETALFRAMGATPGQVRLLVLGEALLVALVSTVAGCLAAVAAAPGFAAWLVSLGAAPQGFSARLSVPPLVVAAVAGLVVALLGAASATQQAVGVGPAEAMRQAVVDRRIMSPIRWIFIGLHLAAGVLLLILYVSAPAALLRDPGMRGPEIKLTWVMVFSLMAITTIVLFAPLLVPPLVRLLTLPTRLSAGAAALLARQNALTATRRTIATAIPTIVVVATAGCVTGGVLAFGDAWRVQERQTMNASYVAAPSAGSAITPRTPAELRTGPGAATAAVTPLALIDPRADYPPGSTRIDTATGPVTADAVDGDPRTAWRLRVQQGSLAGFGGRAAAVSADLAKAHGWRVGDQIGGALPDGAKITVLLAAIYRPPAGFPEVLLPAAATAGHLRGAATTVYLTTPPGTTAPAADGVTWIPATTWIDRSVATQAKYDRITMIAIAGPALLYALIAIVNTMIMSTRDRRRDFTTLRLAGSGTGQVLRMVALESTLVVAIATLLGLAATVAVQAGATVLINHDVLDRHATVAFRLPWTALGLGAAGCLILAVLASGIPARFALRASV